MGLDRVPLVKGRNAAIEIPSQGIPFRKASGNDLQHLKIGICSNVTVSLQKPQGIIDLHPGKIRALIPKTPIKPRQFCPGPSMQPCLSLGTFS